MFKKLTDSLIDHNDVPYEQALQEWTQEPIHIKGEPPASPPSPSSTTAEAPESETDSVFSEYLGSPRSTTGAAPESPRSDPEPAAEVRSNAVRRAHQKRKADREIKKAHRSLISRYAYNVRRARAAEREEQGIEPPEVEPRGKSARLAGRRVDYTVYFPR